MEAISLNPFFLSMASAHGNNDSNDSGNHYIPGTCNIGPAEIRMRKIAALSSLAASVIFVVVLLYLDVNREWRLALFLPVTSFAISYQQWKSKFCVAFGIGGIFNFEGLGKKDVIVNKEYKKKDLAKAWQMIGIGLATGVIAAVAFYYLPV